MFDPKIANQIKKGKIGVIPTDTVYGLVSNISPESIERMYEVKKRDTTKPFVFLISDLEDLETLGIEINESLQNILSEYWPGPTSVILEGENIPEYLHRGEESLAIRLPDNESLQELISKTGPLASTSANLEDEDPATTIEESKEYFKDSVDFYVGKKVLTKKASKIIKITDGVIKVIRD